MTSISQQVEECIKTAIKNEFNTELEGPLKLTRPPEPELGDYAFACFPLAKTLRMGPPVIASKIKPLLESSDLFEQVDATGPYLNIKINKPALARITLNAVLEAPEAYGRSDSGKDQSVLIEYSAPNTNKPQHLGHVRNNLIGLSLVKLKEACGHQVYPVNLVNDRGVHICKSMLAYEKFGQGVTPDSENRKGDHLVGDFYVKFAEAEAKEKEQWKTLKGDDLPQDKKKADELFLKESKLNEEARQMLLKWEDGDKETKDLWEKMNNWVYEGFDKTYARLGCEFKKTYHESETYQLGKELVKEGLESKVFFKKEDGSVWIDLKELKLDEKLVLRRDGTSVYITQDLGTTKLKFDDFKMDKAVWVVADEQIYHFKVLFAVLKKLGFEWADDCFHLAYGMVDLPEGKMKSRTGTVVDADDLMDELFRMEIEEIKSRDLPIKEEDLEATAEILAQGALKFFILKFMPKTRMTFNPRESISPEGFTGPYVQYAYVRIRSIFRKAGLKMEELMAEDRLLELLTNPDEAAVIRRIQDFPEEVKISADSYNPSRLCAYLFELARDFNRFYHNSPVLKADKEEIKTARLLLSKAVALVLKQGLFLLGIQMPERM